MKKHPEHNTARNQRPPTSTILFTFVWSQAIKIQKHNGRRANFKECLMSYRATDWLRARGRGLLFDRERERETGVVKGGERSRKETASFSSLWDKMYLSILQSPFCVKQMVSGQIWMWTPMSTFFTVQNCNSMLRILGINGREITSKLCLTCFDVNCTYDNIETQNSVTWQTKTISQTQAERRDIQLCFLTIGDRVGQHISVSDNGEVVLKPCIWDVVHEIHNGKHWQMASVCFHWGLRLVHLS